MAKHKRLVTLALLSVAIVAGGQLAFAQRHHGSRMPGKGQGQHMMGGSNMMWQGMRGPMMRGGMMRHGCPMMGAAEGSYAKGRIAFIRAELEITDSQKKVFDAYAEALKDNLESMRGMHQAMMSAMQAKTPAERLDAHLGMMESRLAALRMVKPKLEALYAVLSEDQKTKANKMLSGMGCMM